MFGNLPQVTKNLLLLNILIYVVSLVLYSSGTAINFDLAAHYFNSPLFEPYQLVSHMFMHDLNNPLHIIFNMFLLVMFGGHLERIWGSRRYFIFYISCGLGALVLYNSIGVWEIMELKRTMEAAGIDIDTINYSISRGVLDYRLTEEAMQNNINYLIYNEDLAMSAQGMVSTIRSYSGYVVSSMAGASGAIFGLLAGFAMLFPNTQLMLLFPPIPIKAKYLIGGYLVYEVYNSIYQTNDHIAHLAHVGGAVVGIIFILVWRRRDRKNFW